MTVNWIDLLLAYLHDPPDKALSVTAQGSIPGHESRGARFAQSLIGDSEASRRKMKKAAGEADMLASIIERLPMPKEPSVNVKNSRLQVFHPLSARPDSLHMPELNDALLDAEKKQLLEVAESLSGEEEVQARNRFLAVWRLWSDALTANVDHCFARLPADTRTPDHTIWHHLDITAAFKAAEAEGHGAALLAFAIEPVQRFIEAARSVRDLWSGSMILSWLAFRAMLPIVEQLGPTALVYPALRGIPLLDLWLRDAQRLGKKVPLPAVELRLTPSLPHRFLALVPWGENGAAAGALAEQCRQAAAGAWKDMEEEVRQCLKGKFDSAFSGWDKRWDDQIASYFSTSTVVVPLSEPTEDVDKSLARLLTGHDLFKSAFQNAEAVRDLARSIPDEHQQYKDSQTGGIQVQDHAGRWQYQVEMASRLLASQRAVRYVPTTTQPKPDERFPQKCTLLGSFEQMGPDGLSDSKRFWDKVSGPKSGANINGIRIRSGEALCAVSLVKRFVGPVFLAKHFGLEPENLRFPDTWTIAAAEWLSNAEGKGLKLGPKHIHPWNGQWIHWPRRDYDLDEADECAANVFAQIRDARRPERCGVAPVYYAILKLDGDDLGGWLRGENSPKVRDVMHPDLVRYYEGLGQATKAGLDAKRPVGPALHAAISTALANFALHVVPEVVSAYHGTVIYSGGDDTLILVPASQALACALALHNAYASDYYTKDGREYLMMGLRAKLSGGTVIVHAKDDLRLALQDVRRAEKQAKESGRNALAITIRRRSGEQTSALSPWCFAPTVNNLIQQFRSGASDRWAYHLYTERLTLEKLPVETIKAEMRRQLRRTEEPTPSRIRPDEFAAAFESFCQSTFETDEGGKLRFDSVGMALKEFLTLCHTASFLARGRYA